MSTIKALFFKSHQQWYVSPLNEFGNIINQYQIHYDETTKQYYYGDSPIQWLGEQPPKSTGMALISNRYVNVSPKTIGIALDESPMVIELKEKDIKWNDAKQNTVRIQIREQDYQARILGEIE